MTVIRLIAGFAILSFTLWAPLSLFPISLDNSRINRRIKDSEGPHPDEVRNNTLMVSQFVPMSVVNLLAGALAGIGASLFVDGGRLRWPSSQTPIALIAIALILAEFTGVGISIYVARPTRAWVANPSVFRSYLRQLDARGWVVASELADIRKLRSTWSTKTNAWPLRAPDELNKLRLEFPTANEEWASSTPCDPAHFGARLSAEVSQKQVRHWITRKRLWRLGIPPLISGLALAGIIRGLIRLSGLTAWVSILLFVPLAIGCIALLYWWAFRIGRLDLVMVNRNLALERAQLRDCDKQIYQIEERYKRQQASTSPAQAAPEASRLVLRIGQWDLRRHNDE